MAAARWISPLALLALWQLASAIGVLDPDTLESPATILATGWELIETGELPDALLVSLRRAMAGLVPGAIDFRSIVDSDVVDFEALAR